jgi:hypothetical protein
MGQSFWFRGPSLSSRLSADDFRTLQANNSTVNDDDSASVLLATIELKQLLHNVHDILYSSTSHALGMILMGGYSRCVDDFLKTLLVWHGSWPRLAVRPRIKQCGSD